MKKRTVFFIFKIFFSSLLLCYLLNRTNLTAIWCSLKSANYFWIICAFLLHLTGYLFSILRWQLLLSAQKIKVPLRSLLPSYIVGTFFNNFLPTTIGGDTVRAYDTIRYSHSAVKSITVVLVERITGVMALVTIATLALVFEFRIVGNIPLIWISVLVLIIMIFGLILVIQPKAAEQIGRVFNLPLLNKIKAKAKEAHQAIVIYKKEKKRFWGNMAYAFLLQINVILHYYFISLALGFNINPVHFFLIIPIITVILMVPLSINGIGIRENAFVIFLSKFGVEAAASVALSWIAYGMVVVWGVLGGLIYVFRKTGKETLPQKEG